MSTQYEVKRRIPNGHTTLRWCICLGQEIICHRDLKEDAEEMARQFNEDYPIPSAVIPESGETVYQKFRHMLRTAEVISPQSGEIRSQLYGETR